MQDENPHEDPHEDDPHEDDVQELTVLTEQEVSHKEEMLEQVQEDPPEQEMEELPEPHPQLDELAELEDEELDPQLELSYLSLSE